MESQRANDEGRKALSLSDYESAVVHFRNAIAADPSWSVPHYNLGLAYKFLKRWSESRQANLCAFELDPQDEAVYWNLAISSVAVSDWELAGVAFQSIGMTLPMSPPPWDFKLGLIPIRVNPQDSPEVVWCHRLDPVRAKIASIPLPKSGRRFGDVVLNDGEPRGYRQFKGREVPVFDELKVLETSPLHTFEMELRLTDPDSLDGLIGRFEEFLLGAENWSESLRFLCRECSEGIPHECHSYPQLGIDESQRVVLGVSARNRQQVLEVLNGWSGGEMLALEQVL